MYQPEYDIVKPEIGVIGFKLTKEIREQFKRNARLKGASMQELLEAFVMMFNENPDIISLKVMATMSSFRKEV